MSQTLYDIADEMNKLLSVIDEQTDPDREGGAVEDDDLLEALSNTMEDIQLSMSEKTENILRLIQSWEVTESMIKGEEVRLAKKRKALENRRVLLKSYLTNQMIRTGTKKIETTIKNANLYPGRVSVVVDDKFALPQGTFDTEMVIKPITKVISERLKQDIETPGAHLETGNPYVVFR